MKFCSRCGTKCEQDTRFCSECGYQFDGAAIPPIHVNSAAGRF